MLNKFLNYIAEKDLIKKGQRVLLAVSGGIDSMVMADLFVKTGMADGIAHCNFRLRGDESDKDEALVMRFAKRHKLAFFSISFDTMKYAGENGISIQMAARELRYHWFEEIRKKHRFDLIAVAHNLNDNIETLLINLTRGTGISGLTGMKPSWNHIIRPLLFATRSEIAVYCKKNRIRYREDSSNADTKYTRNKIRHNVIPVLKEINPSVETALNETAVRLAEVNEILAEFIDRLFSRSVVPGNNMLKIDLKELEPYKDNTTVLFELFRQFGITGARLPDLKHILSGKTGHMIFTQTHRIIKDRKDILITELPVDDPGAGTANSPEELKRAESIESVRIVDNTPGFNIPADPALACLDLKKVKFPVVIRKWEPGDFFYPLGMKKKKKLSDYLIDRKYSRPEKEKLLILESDGNIFWLIGDRIDNRFRITNKTRKVLIIKSLISR